MSAGEFIDWQAYNEVDPINDTRRLEAMIATLTALTHNVNSSKNGRKRRPKDYMPRYQPRRPQTGEEMLRGMNAMFQAMGGKIEA